MIRKINKVKKGLILNEALAIAKEKGGKCHGFEEGENNSVTLSRKKLLFECRKGHRFQRNYGNMIETIHFV